MKIAIEEKSSVLVANAVHHRIDSLSSVAALLATVGVFIFPTAAWIEPVGEIVIAVMILQGIYETILEAVQELLKA
jgi:divalent metal cation (Fe/Co/Zn/Cd) transporter